MTENILNTKLIEEALKVGAVFGHKKEKTHPRMKPFIVSRRNEVEILDVKQVVLSLEKAINFLKEAYQKKNLILVVGNKPSSQEVVEKFSKEFGFPFVKNRWLGGILTNFSVIRKRIDYYLDLKQKMEKGELQKYTKKEQIMFYKKIQRLEENFSGLVNLTKIPDVIFIIDPFENKVALKESRRLKIPVVAIVDTDDNPDLVDYPIIANDHSKTTVDWIFGKISTSLKEVDVFKESEKVNQ